MTTTHAELCQRLLFDPETTDADAVDAAYVIKEQAARIQQQALEYVSLQAQCDEHLARIAELEKERDALKADADRLDFVIDKQGIIVSQTGADGVRHYQLYQICEYGTGVILSGKILRFDTPRDAIDAALQAEKETRS